MKSCMSIRTRFQALSRKDPASTSFWRMPAGNRFDIVLVAAFDRVARERAPFPEVLDELNHMGIEFVSFRKT